MTSYLFSIDTFSRSRTVFEIFDFKVLRVWPWTLTFRGHPRSRIFLLFEIPYMTSYLTSIDTFSLSRIVVEIYSDDLEDFGGWPWPWTFRCQFVSRIFRKRYEREMSEVKKIFSPIGSSYMTSYLHLLTLSLYLVPFPRYSISIFLGFDLDLWPLEVTWGEKYSHHSKAYAWLPS